MPLMFYVFEFHPFFDGLIGYQSLQELGADILTSTNELKFPSTNIQMFRKYPETTTVQLNTNETKIVNITSSIENGDFLIEQDIELHPNARILSGLYTSKNFKANVLISNVSKEPLELKISKPLIAELKF